MPAVLSIHWAWNLPARLWPCGMVVICGRRNWLAVSYTHLGCFLKLSSGSAANVKPELVLSAYGASLGLEFPLFAFLINRKSTKKED